MRCCSAAGRVVCGVDVCSKLNAHIQRGPCKTIGGGQGGDQWGRKGADRYQGRSSSAGRRRTRWWCCTCAGRPPGLWDHQRAAAVCVEPHLHHIQVRAALWHCNGHQAEQLHAIYWSRSPCMYADLLPHAHLMQSKHTLLNPMHPMQTAACAPCKPPQFACTPCKQAAPCTPSKPCTQRLPHGDPPDPRGGRQHAGAPLPLAGDPRAPHAAARATAAGPAVRAVPQEAGWVPVLDDLLHALPAVPAARRVWAGPCCSGGGSEQQQRIAPEVSSSGSRRGCCGQRRQRGELGAAIEGGGGRWGWIRRGSSWGVIGSWGGWWFGWSGGWSWAGCVLAGEYDWGVSGGSQPFSEGVPPARKWVGARRAPCHGAALVQRCVLSFDTSHLLAPSSAHLNEHAGGSGAGWQRWRWRRRVWRGGPGRLHKRSGCRGEQPRRKVMGCEWAMNVDVCTCRGLDFLCLCSWVCLVLKNGCAAFGSVIGALHCALFRPCVCALCAWAPNVINCPSLFPAGCPLCGQGVCDLCKAGACNMCAQGGNPTPVTKRQPPSTTVQLPRSRLAKTMFHPAFTISEFDQISSHAHLNHNSFKTIYNKIITITIPSAFTTPTHLFRPHRSEHPAPRPRTLRDKPVLSVRPAQKIIKTSPLSVFMARAIVVVALAFALWAAMTDATILNIANLERLQVRPIDPSGHLLSHPPPSSCRGCRPSSGWWVGVEGGGCLLVPYTFTPHHHVPRQPLRSQTSRP